jgi:hypothetical protein
MQFHLPHMLASLFGAATIQAAAAQAPLGAGRGKNRKTPRSRIPGPAQPAGSKLAKAAYLGRVGTW